MISWVLKFSLQLKRNFTEWTHLKNAAQKGNFETFWENLNILSNGTNYWLLLFCHIFLLITKNKQLLYCSFERNVSFVTAEDNETMTTFPV